MIATQHQHPTTADWAAARGDKWSARLGPLEATLAPVDGPLIDALELTAAARIAEVGCGGGGTALELLRRAPAGSIVHAFDVSPRLIARARERARPDEGALVFTVADVATTTPELAYDRLVSRFGVMFFDDPPAAFTNLAGWLAPGGRFAFAVWGPPADNPWMTRVRDVVARFIELPRADPSAPGPFRYADTGRLLPLLERAGLADLAAWDWRGTLPIGGGLAPAAAADFALASFSSFAEQLAEAGEDTLREARRAVTACFADHLQGGAIRMDACVRIVAGARR